MPVYDYACDDCGTFTALRPMSAFDLPCGCPDCGVEAPRVMLTAPALAIARSRQVTKEGRGAELKARLKAKKGG